MSHEVISYLLKNKNMKKRLQFQLVLQCAPFLKRLRAVCIINLQSILCAELDEILGGTDICYAILNQDKGRCLVLFYREQAFADYLNRSDIKEFLGGYGYVSFQIMDVLTYLRKRVELFNRDVQKFPHEMGAILGYPIADVAGFIDFKGQKFLLSGYWKVYDNLQQASRTFQLYDHAKNCALNEFVAGKPIEEISHDHI